MTKVTESWLKDMTAQQVDSEITRAPGDRFASYTLIAETLADTVIRSGRLTVSKEAASRIDFCAMTDLKSIVSGGAATHGEFREALKQHLMGVMFDVTEQDPLVDDETPEGRSLIIEHRQALIIKLANDLLENGNLTPPQIDYGFIWSSCDNLKAVIILKDFEVILLSKKSLTPVPILKNRPIVHVSIPVPSGELIISRTPEIPEFQQILGQIYNASWLNSKKDSIETVGEMVRLAGIALIFGQKRQYGVFSQNGILHLGSQDAEFYIQSDSTEYLGRIENPDQFTTIMDREALLQAFCGSSKSKSQENRGEGQISDWLENYSGDVVIARVEPGTYHLYFGDFGYFGGAKSYKPTDHDLLSSVRESICPKVDGLKLGMLLSPVPLHFEPDILRDLDPAAVADPELEPNL